MARFFGGYSSGSGGNRSGGSNLGGASSSSSLERANAAKDFMKKAKSGQNGLKSGASQYEELVQKKMEQAKARLMAEKKANSYGGLPGAQTQEKEMSKSTQIAMELIAQKMAKKEMKGMEKNERMTIKPTHIMGMYPGYIDSKGRVYNRSGQVVMKINLDSGYVMSYGVFGKKLCKYDPKSMNCTYKMAKELEKDYHKRNKQGPAANIYGTTGGGSAGGSIYGTTGGSSGGSIYGTTSSDDNKGGGWW